MFLFVVSSYLLWILGLGFHAGAALRLWQTREYRAYHVFFLYSIFIIIRSTINVSLRFFDQWEYWFYFYWFTEPVVVALSLWVIYASWLHLFADYEGIRALGRRILITSAVILSVVAIIAASMQSLGKLPSIYAPLAKMETAVRMIQSGLIITLFLLATVLGLPWRRKHFGILFGFGMYASLYMLANALILRLGSAFFLYKDMFTVFAWVACQFLWCCYVFQPAEAESFAALPSSIPLEKWNRALQELL